MKGFIEGDMMRRNARSRSRDRLETDQKHFLGHVSQKVVFLGSFPNVRLLIRAQARVI